MFVSSFPGPRLKTQVAGAIATAVGALAVGACSDSTARTDLRPEGPPDVLAVLVLNDSVSGLVEAATYCKSGDEKRPSLVGLPDFTTTQLCPEDPSESPPMAEDASPDTFYVRIMFDELLNPDIEDLIPILDDNGLETGSYTGTLANTQPVTLKCTGVDGQLHDVPYDGYYSPSGNAVTWPVGPSLVIKPTGDVIVPTNSACEVTIKDNVVDKQGNQVPADQRGPFKFKISGLKPIFVDPSDDGEVDAFQIYFDNIYAQFNGEVQVPSLCEDDGFGILFFGLPPEFAAVCHSAAPISFDLEPKPAGGGLCAASGDPCTSNDDCTFATDPQDTCDFFYAYSLFPFGLSTAEFGIGPISPIEVEKEYTFTLKEGGKLKDRCGVETTLAAPDADAQTKITFTTNPFEVKTPFSISNNDTVPANRKMRLPFTNVVDLGSIDPTSFTMEPAPFLNATTQATNDQMISTSTEGDFMIAGHYQPDTEYTFTLKGGAVIADAYGAMYTNPMDRVIKFKTQPIAITASSPANGATITKATPTSVTRITFTFNQAMDLTTFTADDIEFTGAATTLSFSTGATGSTRCTAGSTGCQLRISGVFAPGEYSVKLKKDTVINDVLGNQYTQPSDRVIKFTVKEADPEPVIPCLGS